MEEVLKNYGILLSNTCIKLIHPTLLKCCVANLLCCFVHLCVALTPVVCFMIGCAEQWVHVHSRVHRQGREVSRPC